MDIVSTVFGVVAAGMTALIIHYEWIILQHFRKHEDLSLTQFFEDARAPGAFNVVGTTSFIYAMTLFVSVAATAFAVPQLETISQVGTLIVLAGFTYFFWLIADITRKH